MCVCVGNFETSSIGKNRCVGRRCCRPNRSCKKRVWTPWLTQRHTKGGQREREREAGGEEQQSLAGNSLAKLENANGSGSGGKTVWAETEAELVVPNSCKKESRLSLLLGRCHNPRLYGSCICQIHLSTPKKNQFSLSLSLTLSGIFVSLSQPAFHSSVCCFFSLIVLCVFSANGSASAFLLTHTHAHTQERNQMCHNCL